MEALYDVRQLGNALVGSHGDRRKQVEALDKVLALATQWENKPFLGSENIKLIELLLDLIPHGIESEGYSESDIRDNADHIGDGQESGITCNSTLLESFEVQIFSASGLAKVGVTIHL